MFKQLLIIFISIQAPLLGVASPLGSTYPYFSVSDLLACADHFAIPQQQITPARVQAGDIIFLPFDDDCRGPFFKDIYPHIQQPFILITGLSDNDTPAHLTHLLNDPRIIRWYGQNASIVHPKFTALPCGLTMWINHDQRKEVITSFQEKVKNGTIRKKYLASMKFSVWTCPLARKECYDHFVQFAWCNNPPGQLTLEENYQLVAESLFSVSPRGTGLDAHRTWEALLLGTYPIVLHSDLDQLYEGLPVVVVDKWSDVTEELLNQKYQEFQQTHYPKMEILFDDYWFNQLQELKQQTIELFKSAEVQEKFINDVATFRQWLIDRKKPKTVIVNKQHLKQFLAAARQGNLKQLSRLLRTKRVPINTQDRYGMTALHHAVVAKNKKTVRFLLMHGADKRIKNRRNKTARQLAKNRAIRLLV